MEAEIIELLKSLHLKGMVDSIKEELARADKEAATPAEVLVRLLKEESRHRREQSLCYRLKQAKIPWSWSLDTFPFSRQPSINQGQIRSLAGLAFLQRAENIVFIGHPGTGKTGLAISLLRQALLGQYRGRFFNAQELMDTLYASLADRSTSQTLKQLANYDLYH